MKKYVTRAHKLGFYSHYARYLYDDRFRQDCDTNGVAQALYYVRKKHGREWQVPAEKFEIPDEVAQNWGIIPGFQEEGWRASRKGDGEGAPDDRWVPTDEGREIFSEACPRPLRLGPDPEPAQEGRSSRRKRSERRRATSRTSYYRGGWKPQWEKK